MACLPFPPTANNGLSSGVLTKVYLVTVGDVRFPPPHGSLYSELTLDGVVEDANDLQNEKLLIFTASSQDPFPLSLCPKPT